MKKILSLVLVLVLALGSFSFAAPQDVVGTDYESAVSKLMGLSVLTGYPDDTFKPAATITRAELAAVAVRLLGLESAAEYAKGSTKFSDVPGTHWASGYVNIAVDQGIILGYANGTFKPAAPVTNAEAITMIVRVLGYAPEVDEKGTWPSNYIAKAATLGLTDGVSFVGSAPAKRGDIALFADNSLLVALMIRTGFGDEAKYQVASPKQTLLADKIKVTQFEATVVDTLSTNADISKNVKMTGITNVSADPDVAVGDKNYSLAKGVTYDFDQVLGQKVTFYTKDDKIVAVDKMYKKVRTTLLNNVTTSTVSFKAIDPADATATKEYSFGKKTAGNFTVTGAATYVVKNASEKLVINGFAAGAADLTKGKYVDLFIDEDGYVAGFQVHVFSGAKKVQAVTGTTIEVDGPDLKLAGQVYDFNLSSLAKDDYFFYYRTNINKDDKDDNAVYKYTIVKRAAAVEAKYTKLSASGNSVTVGDKVYARQLNGLASEVNSFVASADFDDLLGKLVKITFGVNGMIDSVTNKDTAADSNYAVMINAGAVTGAYGAQTVTVKLVNSKNETVELVLTSDALIYKGANSAKLDALTVTPGTNTVTFSSGAGAFNASPLTLAKADTGANTVVTYKLNSAGKITELKTNLTLTALAGSYDVKTNKIGATARITADTLVYSQADDKFFALKDLQEVAYTGFYNIDADNAAINGAEFVLLTGGAVADASKYAFYKDKASVLDAFEARLFIDGALKSFVTKDADVTFTGLPNTGGLDLVKVAFVGDKISTIDKVTAVAPAAAFVKLVKDSRVLVLTGAGATYDYEADVTVVINDDGTYKVGSVDDLVDEAINTYAVFNTDSDARIEYILVIRQP